MNILIVTPEYPPKVGGMGRSAERLGTSLAVAGHEATILTYHRTENVCSAPYTLVDADCVPRLRVLRVGPIAAKYSGAEPETKAFLKRQFLEQSLRAVSLCPPPALVLSFGLVDAGFVGSAIAQALGLPHVVSARGADVGTEIFQGEKFALAQWVISRSAAVTFVNRYLHDVAVAVFGRSSHFKIIHNSVPDPGRNRDEERGAQRESIRRRLEISNKSHVIGWTGTFRAKKGIPCLDEAFRILVDQGRDVYLLIVGGPRNEKERAYCPSMDSHNLSTRTRCVGLLSNAADVYPYYQAMDVFAYPSLDDGLSNSVLEAMAFEVPIVATEIFQDVAVNETTALLVPRFDVSALALAILRILDEPGLARRLSAAAKTMVLDTFSPRREVESYLSLFQELTGGGTGARRGDT